MAAILVTIICYKTRKASFRSLSEVNSISFENDYNPKQAPPPAFKSAELPVQKVSLA